MDPQVLRQIFVVQVDQLYSESAFGLKETTVHRRALDEGVWLGQHGHGEASARSRGVCGADPLSLGVRHQRLPKRTAEVATGGDPVARSFYRVETARLALHHVPRSRPVRRKGPGHQHPPRQIRSEVDEDQVRQEEETTVRL